MCKDNETKDLIEVSASLRDKYADQANSAPMSFLLNGLNLLSKADLEYRSRKNKRLHVELVLMKIAHMNAAVNLVQHDSTGSSASLSTGTSTTPGTGEKKK